MKWRRIYDSVHGFIHFNDIEKELIDSPIFQRLHYIHQLGISYLVYPGATHTRFEHALGTMELATRIFDQTLASSPLSKEVKHLDYFRQILRLAALCHDLGHLPFSHAAEKRLLGEEGHEKWTRLIILSDELSSIWQKVAQHFHKQDVVQDIIKLAIGVEKLATLDPKLSFSTWDRVFAQIIAGDFFGSDRMDYLLRDAKATGLSYGLFDYSQLIEMLRVLDFQNHLTLGIEENGIESCEALLLSRHFMFRRLYQHPSTKAYAFHLSRFMKTIYNQPSYVKSLSQYLSMSEPDILCQLKQASNDPGHPGHIDAQAIASRKLRFKAIALNDIKEKELLTFKKSHHIEDLLIGWELSEKKMAHYGLSIPVLTTRQKIIHSKEISEIRIPAFPINWLYIAPKFEEDAIKAFF